MSEALYALLKQKTNTIKANLGVGYSATTERAGIIRIATLIEASAGQSNDTAITPYTLKEASDLRYGTSINLDLDPETFQLTMSLINGAGEVLNSDTIDLPNENAIVDVDYNNDVKSLIFTYQNAEPKVVSIRHLIDGLQKEITLSNMLSSDLVDDTSKQHKFVTPEERQKLDDTIATAVEINQLYNSGVETSDLTKLHNISSSANEVNQLHNSGVETSDLTKLHNISSSANEVNQLHGSEIEKADLEKLHAVTATANELNILDGATLTTEELNYVDGVTSGIQGQLNNKLELTSLSIKSDSTDYLGYDNINGQISAKVDTTVTQSSSKLITSGGVQTAISNAQSADNTYTDNAVVAHNTSSVAHTDIRKDISDIEALIPEQATAENQLADKDFVNSSIATSTANFIGTFSSVSDLRAYSGTVTNNDYAFVINSVVTDNGNDWATFAVLDAYDKTLLTNFDYAWVINGSKFDLYRFDIVTQVWESRATSIDKEDVSLNNAYNRYKATVHGHEVQWDYEYTLNNSSFTANQWIAINSNITPELTAQITTNKNNIATNTANIATNTANIATIQGDYVSKSRTVNGKALSSNITLNANDVSALPASTTINDLTTEAQQDALNSTATQAKINQIATNTANIATNTANITTNTDAISTINGKIPSNASTTNKMTTANDLSNAVENLANKQLDNLDRAGDDKLYALRGLYNNGELLTDAEGLADVKEYAHSTFDAGKFTKVGSPTITDDGIASGFSDSNYLTANLTFTPANSLKYTCGFTTGNDITTVQAVWRFYNNLTGTYITNAVQVRNGKIRLQYADASYDDGYACAANTTYYVELEFTATSAIGKIYKNGILDYTSTYAATALMRGNNSNLNIGVNTPSTYTQNFLGTINLKQFSITVDGVPVFSGNKTGIDTIFDNISVAKTGNPTITTDGILTSSDTSNYLKYSVGSLPASWSVENTVVTPALPVSATTTALFVKRSDGYNNIATIRIDNNQSKFTLGYYNSGGTYTTATYNVTAYTKYHLKVETQGSNIKMYINGVAVVTASDLNTSVNIDFIGIGSAVNGANPWLGTLDLNTFKYIVNGDLVYQPCLKIPYTESKTGSKITQSIYLDRVKDAYEQGYLDYQYYTLDEAAGNFTLPYGELYGLINHNTQAILEDKSDISAIQEVIPDDTTSSNKLISASTLSTSIANFADKDLANLSTTGNKKLRAIKGYEELGGVLEDITGYSNVEILAHSTFDRSKFIVVDSPNITDDGIVSGFSDSNYLTTSSALISLSTANTWVMDLPAFTPNANDLSGLKAIIDNTSGQYSSPCIGLSDGKLFVVIATSEGGWEINAPDLLTVSANTKYYLRLQYTGTHYILDYKTSENSDYTNILNWAESNKIYVTDAYKIGNYSNGGRALGGSIDLKQFSITVDGAPVFSGNRTGIDTIKPNDYTVVGTPTISADGIASGFNYYSACLATTFNPSNYTWKIKVKVKPTSVSEQYNAIFGGNDGWIKPHLYFDYNKLGVFLTSNGSFWDIAEQITGTHTYSVNTDYYLILEYTGTQYIASYSIDDINYIQDIVINNSSSIYNSSNDTLLIGAMFSGAKFTGSIDLNAFKIYVDGNLVYQPCLKMPYTEIKEGGKVANALYRDRVLDAFKQNYTSYSYYTIDETNQNYTLPTGNVYSLIESKRASNPQNTVDIDAITQYSALETGALSTNLTVYDQLVKRRYSSFDLSKFTVVGSPTITNDGIARGFTPYTSWITLPLTPKDFKGHSWKIKAKWINENADQNGDSNVWVQPLLSIHSDYPSTGSIAIGRGATGTALENTLNIRFLGATYTGSEANNEGIHIETAITPLPDYCIVSASFDYQTGEYKLWADIGNGDEYIGSWIPTTTQKELRIIYNENTNNIHQGCCLVTYVHDALDLKYTYIEMDGVPVLSGNKTGIDTIKSNDYTVVGSPTISEDGVASGFAAYPNTNAYLRTPSINFGNTFLIEGAFTTGVYSGTHPTGTWNCVLGRGGSSEGGLNLNIRENSVYLRLIDSDGTNIYQNFLYVTSTNLENYSTYKYQIGFNGSEYRVKIIDISGIELLNQAVTSSTKIRNGKLAIGVNQTDQGYDAFLGSIDLNSFKIYVDGDLVYQPCLKIPYIESKTGSKVVDSYYRNRVKNAYEYQGYAPYFTLGDKDFTLPHGDIYGMMYKLIDQIVDAKLAELNQ